MFIDIDGSKRGGQRRRPPAEHVRPASWSAPGTCGEFVQGRLDGIDYLVNCPIDRFSTATVRSASRRGIGVATPTRHSKVARLLDLLGAGDIDGEGLEIEISSDLPEGKGMASSTADLLAALGAAAHHMSFRPCTYAIAKTLVAVEPSDCTHVPGVGHVGHLCGRVFGAFRPPSALRVLVVDCGEAVDTMSFDRARAHHVYAANEATVRCALSATLRALVAGDAVLLARAATTSARLSQQILFKPAFETLARVAQEEGALGVNCAHSGSVLGILYRPGGDRAARLRHAVAHELGADATIVGDHAFISGGIYVDRR